MVYHNKKESIPMNYSIYKLKFINWLFLSFSLLSQKSLIIQKEFDLFTGIYGRRTVTTQLIEKRKGISPSRVTTWRFFNQTYSQSQDLITKLYQDKNSIIWIDNYSKFYKLSHQGNICTSKFIKFIF